LNKKLFILATNYPYGYGEHFLENELLQLAPHFERVYVIATDQRYIGSIIMVAYVPDNVTILEYKEQETKFDKFFSLRFLFSKDFFHDVLFFKKISFQFLKIFAVEKLRTKKLSKFLENYISSRTSPWEKCYVYSYWNDYTAASVALIKRKHPEIKAFTKAHGWDVYFERHPMGYFPLRSLICENLDKLFFISINGKNYFSSKFPKYKDKFITSRLGTKNETLLSTYKQSKELVLMSCSSIIPLKNLPCIVEALALIDSFNITWIHLGNGDDEVMVQLLAEEKLSKKSNVNYNFKGFVMNEKIHEYYREHQTDLFINVSTTEGIPVSIMEAMSYGIPVIATTVGGTPEIVDNKHNGFLLSPTPTAQEVADTISKFYNLSFEEKTAFRNQAYETWNSKFNAQINYTKFIEEIMKL
jgi:glycosyltransferase involved in cell wall biosynthesis